MVAIELFFATIFQLLVLFYNNYTLYLYTFNFMNIYWIFGKYFCVYIPSLKSSFKVILK